MISPLSAYRFFRDGLSAWIGWSLGIAALVQVAVLLLLNPGIRVQKAPEADGPFLQAAEMSREGEEQMVLQESESLFLPTPLNYGYQRGGNLRIAQRTDFDVPVPELWVKPGTGLGLGAGKPFIVPPSWEALGLAHWNPARYIGYRDQPVVPLSARQALLQVENLADGKIVWSEPVELGLGLSEAGTLWRPVNFLCQINVHGVEGQPLLAMAPGQSGMPGTGFPAIDTLIKVYVEKYPWATRLPPGSYRLIVSP